MASAFKPKTLVQFHLMRSYENAAVRVLPHEDVQLALDRKLGRVDLPDPVKVLKAMHVKAPGLIKLMLGSKLELVDATSQVRIGKGGKSYRLLTFEFGTKPTDRSRRKVLAGDGMKALETLLATPWKYGNISTFPNEPDTCSIHFSVEMTDAEVAKVTTDANAATFGLVTHELAPKVESTG